MNIFVEILNEYKCIIDQNFVFQLKRRTYIIKGR